MDPITNQNSCFDKKETNHVRKNQEIGAGRKENCPHTFSSILISIVRDKDEPALIMEVRSMNVWQSGEICFPGGHIRLIRMSRSTAEGRPSCR